MVNGKRYSVVDAGNYTSNIREMLDEAFEVPDWKYINGMVCKEAMFIIEKAIARMQADPAHYKKFNPKNGWGEYNTAIQ